MKDTSINTDTSNYHSDLPHRVVDSYLVPGTSTLSYLNYLTYFPYRTLPYLTVPLTFPTHPHYYSNYI